MIVDCVCGARYQLDPKFAGKKLKCKKCEAIIQVPAAEPEPDVLQPAVPPVTSQPSAPPVQPPPPPSIGNPYAGKRRRKATDKTKRVVNNRSARKTVKSAPKSKQGMTRSEREAAAIEHHSSGTSLEERMAARRKDSIETHRYTNGIKFMALGGFLLVVALVCTILLWGWEQGGGILVILLPLYWIGGKYWFGPLVALVGFCFIYIGFGSMVKLVDIDSEAQLPDQF